MTIRLISEDFLKNLKFQNVIVLSQSLIDFFRYLNKDVVNFEPKSALYGGLDGTSEIRKVIKRSSELIKKNGKLILEIGFDQKKSVKELLRKKGFYVNNVVKDFSNHDRCIISTKL